jgi:hypothetical protein
MQASADKVGQTRQVGQADRWGWEGFNHFLKQKIE